MTSVFKHWEFYLISPIQQA